MKNVFFVTTIIAFAIKPLVAQDIQDYSKIDLMMMRGNYEKVIDTCKLILTHDSLNPEIYYKMGIAYQNTLNEDSSLNCFYQASNLCPDNKVYNFSLAKGYYGKDKLKMAEPLFSKLYSTDSVNWIFATYLSNIYMQSGKFDDALSIYKRFLIKDSTNYIYYDRAGLAYLKKGDYSPAIDLFKKSLSINKNNINAIKNLSYLYALTLSTDTAIQLLSKGIKIDSTDIDLYARRAQLYYIKHYTKRALDDYLVILASGDSSKLYLKRIGIGYCYNLQPGEAIPYLLKAYKSDSTDYETCSFLGQSYFKISDMSNSVCYYKKALNILIPVNAKLGLTYVLCAESQKGNDSNMDAIESYLKAYAINSDPNLNMIIANIYDEKLKNPEKAIYYYQRFLNTQRSSRMKFPPKYIEKVEKRLEFLKTDSPK
ncbi:MAG: tetratricopeptide repeat protein [Bacteroidales bacterium]|nr:tetratricopeptide repeat protein [Bacteroidales bacterium]